MSNRPRLRFYCRGEALAPDPNAAARGIRRCVGRRWQEVLPGRWAWVPSGKPDAVDYHHDLVKYCKEGDLWPADEATATACGVAFDPTFGNEPTQTIKEFKAAHAAAQDGAPKVEEPAKAEPKDLAKQPTKVGGKGD